MPHQLRRVIAVNIRAAKTGQPSQLFAQLDPRGGVLAVGVNGVGKTTFLRTIPLFYGATPQQILKGSHKGSMISYTLPDPTSAIVYEYERTTAEDLRCTVMYCRPGEDEPVFHIMRSGFDEKFFLNENDEFLTREEFKDRAEARKVYVTPMLRMHQYRAVILSERSMTKEGRELRNLALEHSLGPSSLHNLQQIAAAMTTEKINFNDLKNIVVDRITEDSGASVSKDASISHRQNREDLKGWLDARQHMVSILARKPDADRLQEIVRSAKASHLKLCALNVAVRATITQLGKDREALDAQRKACEAAFTSLSGTLSVEINQKDTAAYELDQELSRLNDGIARTESTYRQFELMDIKRLVALSEREEAIRESHRTLQADFDALTTSSKSAEERATVRKAAIEKSLAASKSRISRQREDHTTQNKTRNSELHTAEVSALEALTSPVRLNTISQEQRNLSQDRGRLGAELGNPAATAETADRLRACAEELARINLAVGEATGKREESGREAERRKVASEEAIRAIDNIEAQIREGETKLAEIRANLEPQAGSLLAFLRGQDPTVWESAAKVLDQQLLKRTDLQPGWIEEISAAGRRLAIGNVEFDIDPLAIPAWVDMQELRNEEASCVQRLANLKSKLTEAQKDASKRAAEYKVASEAHNQQLSNESITQQAAKNSQSSLEKLHELERQEKQAAAARLQQEITAVKKRLAELEQEAIGIQNDLKTRREAIKADFKSQREAVNGELEERLSALKEEASKLEAEAKSQVDQVDKDLATERRGLGLDEVRISTMQGDLEKLSKQIEEITLRRGDIQAWETFSKVELPNLGERKRDSKAKAPELERLKGEARKLRDELNQAREQNVLDLQEIDTKSSANLATVRRLEDLQVRIKDFIDYSPSNMQVTWDPMDLETQVTQSLSELSNLTSDMQSLTRTLRSEIQRQDGAPADWLVNAERELPDSQTRLPHEFEWTKAEVVCRWFDPVEHGQHIVQLNRMMQGIYLNAKGVMDAIETFDRNIAAFNRKLQKALDETATFESFGDLAVKVQSGVGKIDFIKTLERIQARANELMGPRGNFMTNERELPADDDARLMREYRDRMPVEGGLRINLRDQIEMTCYLRENNYRHEIRNQEEFQAVSSNGLTALITTMFLMGFAQMVRGSDSPVHLTWVADEIARIDGGNVAAFLKTLEASRINVICAAPSPDPALARYFDRLCTFERDGSILTAAAEEDLATGTEA